MNLYDLAALLCGFATITGALAICAIFGLYELEDRLAGAEDE